MIHQTLAHYRISASIGAGGMGEVFRARDTRLHRDVAIKILPKEFASDPDRLRRFEQESKTLAALNHPNILTIYDANVHEGAPYLVSELLEGKTLREEIGTGNAALPIRKATDYALQIAQGLAAAHSKGIIHRDLKPENIFITKDGRVKILDFGLAKPQPTSQSQIANQKSQIDEAAPTLVQTTEPGMVLGTPGYMSPEQVRGEHADHRSDIFAFGCVLYEMLTGQRAFRRDTPVESMNAVLKEEPPELNASAARIPPVLERVVRRCLEKSPERRFQAAGDLAFALENIGTESAAAPLVAASESPMKWPAWVLGTSALALVVLLWWISSKKAAQGPGADGLGPVTKFQVTLGTLGTSDPRTGRFVALSPDGKKLAFANQEGLWLDRLDRVSDPVLLVTGSSPAPFWSPDSAALAFFDKEHEQLYRTSLDGTRPLLLCQLTNLRTATWLTSGRILFTSKAPGLFEVPAQPGGTPMLALAVGSGESDFHEPSALPQGRGALFVIHHQPHTGDSLGVWTPDGRRKEVLHIPGALLRAPVFSSGHIVCARFDADFEGIWAVPFSLQRLECTREPFRISDVGAFPSASDTGTLAFLASKSDLFGPRVLTWVDRSGKILGTVGKPMNGLSQPRLSPDGRQVLAIARESRTSYQVWQFDTVSGGAAPLFPSSAGFYMAAEWSDAGHNVLFNRFRPGAGAVVGMRASDGMGEEQVLFDNVEYWVVSPSGQYLLVRSGGTNGYARLADADKKLIAFPEAFQKLPEQWTLSPDDHLLAYVMYAQGQADVFVVEFPSFANRRPVSRDGGQFLRWNPNGQELFFLSNHGRAMMSARFKPGTTEFEAPVKLFDMPASIEHDLFGFLYDVALDGRFLMLQKTGEHPGDPGLATARVQIVLNWLDEFRDKR